MKQPCNLQLTSLTAAALLAASFNCPAADAPTAAKQEGRSPVKVFVLAGQSNMEGPAVVDIGGKDCNDGHGNLETLMKDPAKAPILKHLRGADGKWEEDIDIFAQPRSESPRSLPCSYPACP